MANTAAHATERGVRADSAAETMRMKSPENVIEDALPVRMSKPLAAWLTRQAGTREERHARRLAASYVLTTSDAGERAG
ncbi:hypothetical protein AB4Y32_14885 [Paraburkholderia phymatum]|uniref:Uncharacterized protein n=1 Tax=Paraburkholderia phymatum TaxID=148447 RepID=A0ACC6U0A9_9BURK